MSDWKTEGQTERERDGGERCAWKEILVVIFVFLIVSEGQ